MTCIVGWKTGTKVTIAGDSLGVTQSFIQERKDKKVFAVDGVIFGFTSSFRMGQILNHSFSVPEPDAGETNLERYLVNEFVEDLRSTFQSHGFGDGKVGGQFMIGIPRNFFHFRNDAMLVVIDSDFQISIPANSFDSVGSGMYFALGSLATSEKLLTRPEEKLKTALKIADQFSPGVGGTYWYLDTENTEVRKL